MIYFDELVMTIENIETLICKTMILFVLLIDFKGSFVVFNVTIKKK